MLSQVDKKFFKLAVGSQNIGKETDVDISARCPICGDSRTKKNSKRLHLYTKGNITNVNCFNGDCACKNKTVYSFLRDFFPSHFSQYKRETFSSTMSKLSLINSSGISNSSDSEDEDVFSSLVQNKEIAKETIPDIPDVIVHDLTPYLHKIEDHPEALQYLKNRGFDYSKLNYGDWYFGYQDLKIGDILYKITDSIVIPLYYNNTMYGFYSRSIKNKTFYTYMLEQNIGYKIWNWFNIDKSQPVFIFEGIFDAISSGLDNIIALMGAKIPDSRLKELEQPVFVLDNDKTGLINSIQYSKSNKTVYIQPNEYTEKDMNELMLNNPNIDIPNLIKRNLYTGISAEIRLKSKL